MTSFERVRIIGARAEQLANGAPRLRRKVDTTQDDMDPLWAEEPETQAAIDVLDPSHLSRVAEGELDNGMLDWIIVERELPGGRVERWSVAELRQ